jgi:hypothetical protein
MKKYRIVKAHYAKGVFYPAGSVIEMPDDLKPARNWTEVDDNHRPVRVGARETKAPPSQTVAGGGKPPRRKPTGA